MYRYRQTYCNLHSNFFKAYEYSRPWPTSKSSKYIFVYLSKNLRKPNCSIMSSRNILNMVIVLISWLGLPYLYYLTLYLTYQNYFFKSTSILLLLSYALVKSVNLRRLLLGLPLLVFAWCLPCFVQKSRDLLTGSVQCAYFPSSLSLGETVPGIREEKCLEIMLSRPIFLGDGSRGHEIYGAHRAAREPSTNCAVWLPENLVQTVQYGCQRT